MGRLGCLVIVIIAVVVGYQYYSNEKTRRGFAAIAKKLNIGGVSGSEPSLVTVLARAERHTRRASELIDKRRFDEAKAELSKALGNLKSANEVSSDMTGDVAEFLGEARDKAVALFSKTWTEISQNTSVK